jgi:NTE family protein
LRGTIVMAKDHARPDDDTEPPDERRGVALCLSGGGFRAALFHLGALRRLAEVGALGAVDTVSAVSGGSILAAHLAQRLRPWPVAGEPVGDWEVRIAAPFRAFCATSLRTRPLLLRWALPWNWPRAAVPVEALARAYERRLTALRLAALPARPAFVFCATDLVFGVNFELGRTRLGDWQAGYAAPPADLPLARAVAASSCFPPVFGPFDLGIDVGVLAGGRFPAGAERERLLRRLRLSDGGLYDNLGLEPVWKTHQVVLVSDGGAPFRAEATGASLRLLRRYLDVAGAQGASVRKRWLIASYADGAFAGAYWGIASATSRYGAEAPAGYPAALVENHVARVRTDLDAFLADECGVLENHGYLLAEAALRRHLPALVAQPAPVVPPRPDLLDPVRAAAALRGSGSRFSLRRWWARGRGAGAGTAPRDASTPET